MVKFVDMTWLADKSLDIYCEKTCSECTIPKLTMSNTRFISSSVMKIFGEVLDYAIAEYSKKYDKILFAVPCFPITRMDKITIMSRFLCNNSDFLSENGISSSQYQEMFEKFICSKCKNEYITQISEKAYILNNRGILLKDWKDVVLEKFGTSLVNAEKDCPFDATPDLIINFEFGDIDGKFTKLPAEEKYRIGIIIDNLTKN